MTTNAKVNWFAFLLWLCLIFGGSAVVVGGWILGAELGMASAAENCREWAKANR